MRRIVLALKMLFASAAILDQVQRLLAGDVPSSDVTGQAARAPTPAPSRATKPRSRSDALTLLATLQREARFVDFVMEPLGEYSDAQIGAAARDVHRDCGKALERLFDIKAFCSEAEGAEIEVPAGFDTGCFQLTGNVSGEPPYRGQLVHQGWRAARCELPTWTGSEDAAQVLAPTQIEIK